MATAGRILIIPKGEYDAEKTYEMLDLVTYNGISWLAKKTAVGIEPSEGNEEYWQNLFDFAYVPLTNLIDNQYVDAQYTVSGKLCFVYLGNAKEALTLKTKYKVGSLPSTAMQLHNCKYAINGREWVVDVELTSVYVNCVGGEALPEDGKPYLGFVIPVILS